MPTIIPVGTPAAQAQNQPTPQQSARERAIAKLTGGNQPQSAPVQDATRVSPEELGAIRAPQSQGNEGQSSVSETTPSADPAKADTSQAKDEPALSSQYAVLARKEKQFRAKVAAEQAQLKLERDALEKTKAELAAKDAEYQSKYIPKERLTEDTINVLLEAGISYDQITQMMLQQGTAHQDPVLKAQLAELKASIKAQQDAVEEAKKAAQDAQSQQYEEAVRQITHETEILVKSDPNFEAIRETGSVKDVVDLIKKTFKEDGVLLTVEEAAKEVEDHLVEQLSKYAQKIKKLQQKFQPQGQKPQGTPQSSENRNPPTQQQPAQAKTLTNSMAVSRPLSAKERAILAFKGELKK